MKNRHCKRCWQQSTPQNYAWLDKQPISSTQYYRLKQVDIDRKFTYSNIISLQNESRKTPLKLFPNPTHDIVFIEAENREQPFVLYNATGQVLYQANTIPYKLDMTIQAAGLYFLKVKQEELKFVKQ